MDRSKKVADYLHRIMQFSRHPLVEASEGALESMVEVHTETTREGTAALEGLDRVRKGEDLSADQVGALEAIIHREGRPAIDVRGDSYLDVPFEWREQLEQAKPMLELRIPCVGRVQASGPTRCTTGPRSWSGRSC